MSMWIWDHAFADCEEMKQSQGFTGHHLAPEQGGRFISEAWSVQVYRHIPSPKSSYVADWGPARVAAPDRQRHLSYDSAGS